jgi:hypothetical protein
MPPPLLLPPVLPLLLPRLRCYSCPMGCSRQSGCLLLLLLRQPLPAAPAAFAAGRSAGC